MISAFAYSFRGRGNKDTKLVMRGDIKSVQSN